MESVDLVGDTLLVLDRDAHLARRRLELEVFNKEALLDYEARIMGPVAEQCLAECARQRDADGLVRTDLVILTRRMLLQIAAAVIGLDNVDKAAWDRLTDLLDGILDGVLVEWSTLDHDAVISESLKAKAAYWDEFVSPAAERRRALVERQRRGEIEESDLPRDLLTVLLKHSTPEDQWTDERLLREAILYLAASVSSTSTAVIHTLSELTRWVAAHPDYADRLQDVEVLRHSASEALRVHPPTPAILRRATSDVVLKNGREFHTGDIIALDLHHSNHDQAVFGQNAGEFELQREFPSGVAAWGHSFGQGRHACIGRPIAMGNEAAGTEGTVVTLLLALYRAGVQVDPERPPQVAPSVLRRYTSFPVLFTNL